MMISVKTYLLIRIYGSKNYGHKIATLLISVIEYEAVFEAQYNWFSYEYSFNSINISPKLLTFNRIA